jgi:hypothetical protein
MADDRLKNFVLSLADTDYTLSEQVRLVVLAALEGSNDLAEVLGDDATSSELVESLTAVEEEGAEPVGRRANGEIPTVVAGRIVDQRRAQHPQRLIEHRGPLSVRPAR